MRRVFVPLLAVALPVAVAGDETTTTTTTPPTTTMSNSISFSCTTTSDGAACDETDGEDLYNAVKTDLEAKIESAVAGGSLGDGDFTGEKISYKVTWTQELTKDFTDSFTGIETTLKESLQEVLNAKLAANDGNPSISSISTIDSITAGTDVTATVTGAGTAVYLVSTPVANCVGASGACTADELLAKFNAHDLLTGYFAGTHTTAATYTAGTAVVTNEADATGIQLSIKITVTAADMAAYTAMTDVEGDLTTVINEQLVALNAAESTTSDVVAAINAGVITANFAVENEVTVASKDASKGSMSELTSTEATAIYELIKDNVLLAFATKANLLDSGSPDATQIAITEGTHTGLLVKYTITYTDQTATPAHALQSEFDFAAIMSAYTGEGTYTDLVLTHDAITVPDFSVSEPTTDGAIAHVVSVLAFVAGLFLL